MKYHSKKVEFDGIVFDSKKELAKYKELTILALSGYVKLIELQPEFTLLEGFTDKQGVRHRPIKYRADFRVIWNDGREEIIDTKGYKTKEYLIKKKLLLSKYPDINFKEE
jgi:hypothetical protein